MKEKRGIISITERFLKDDDFHIAPTNSTIFDYTWSFAIDLSFPFDNFLKEDKRALFEEQVRRTTELLSKYPTPKTEDLNDYLSANAHRAFELFASCQYIQFKMDEKKTVKFLDANPVLRNKFLVITANTENLTGDDIAHYEKIYAGHTDKLLILMKNNSELVSFEVCRRTIMTVENIIMKINAHNFSPFEAIMYAYDIVRDHKYHEENEMENPNIYRDLSSVLFGDKIVCAGFTNILDALLNRLGIASIPYYLSDTKSDYWHMRVAAFVKDDKYGLKGIYYFDPTWDSREDDTDRFLNSYCYFAKTKKEIEALQNGQYEDMTFGNFSREYLKELKRAVAKREPYNFPKNKKTDIDAVAFLVDGIHLDLDYIRKRTLIKIEEYLDYIDRPIDEKTYLKAFFEVRKVQYYENPERFSFSLEDLTEIYYNSGWDTQDDTPLSGTPTDDSKQSELKTFVEEEELEKKMVRIKLARFLRSCLEKQKRITLKQKTNRIG